MARSPARPAQQPAHGNWANTMGQQSNFMNMDGLDGAGHATLARGSAAVADIVQTVEQNPFAIINQVEGVVSCECGACWAGDSWNTIDHATKVTSALQGHVTLKKAIHCFAHMNELHRQFPQNPEYARAFGVQAYKVFVDVADQNGSWELSWPLLGIPDPETTQLRLTSPVERVAMAALAKEKKIISEITKEAKARRPGGPNAKATPPHKEE